MDKCGVCMCLFTHRLRTYNNWKGKICPGILADAGIFYNEDDDKTICFACRHEFSQWNKDENPWLVHYAEQPDCAYIKANMKAIRIAKNLEIIKNHLKGSLVEALVKSGKFKFDDIKTGLEIYFQNYGIVPQTINGVIYVTEEYLMLKKLFKSE